MASLNEVAKAFKALHKPGDPVVLTNVWDAITAKQVASLPNAKAIATASYAVAAAAGLQDDDLDMETNLRAIAAIAKIANEANKPITADFQDGYGDKLEEGIRQLIKLGVVGINLEDLGRDVGGIYPVEVAQERIRRVMKVAQEEGVPDFVVNARTDTLVTGGDVETAIARGKAYLEAGAANVFIWGGRNRSGWRTAEVEQAVKALDGKLNVSLAWVVPGGLTIKELREIAGVGVARISLGPQVMFKTTEFFTKEAGRILAGESSS